MKQLQSQNPDFEAIAWGAVFILWGILGLVPSIPEGVGTLGLGLILLGLNLARVVRGIPSSSFTTVLGFLALVLGGLKLASPLLHLTFDPPIFAILLIVLGGFILARNWTQKHTA